MMRSILVFFALVLFSTLSDAQGMNAGTSSSSDETKPSSGMNASTSKKPDLRNATQQTAPNININVYSGMNAQQIGSGTTGNTSGSNTLSNKGIVPVQFDDDVTNVPKSLSPNGKIMSYPNQDNSDQ